MMAATHVPFAPLTVPIFAHDCVRMLACGLKQQTASLQRERNRGRHRESDFLKFLKFLERRKNRFNSRPTHTYMRFCVQESVEAEVMEAAVERMRAVCEAATTAAARPRQV